MANQYSSLTKSNIIRKMTRKNSPVTSLAALAREFGVRTTFYRWDGSTVTSVPTPFREEVRSLIGTKRLNDLRRRKHINRYADGSLISW